MILLYLSPARYRIAVTSLFLLLLKKTDKTPFKIFNGERASKPVNTIYIKFQGQMFFVRKLGDAYILNECKSIL